MPQHINNFIELFNQKKFKEAHDVLEEFWQNYQGQDRKYYQALIQISVALHLEQESRLVGAKKVLARATSNMDGYQNQISEIDLTQLLSEVQEYLANPVTIPKIELKH